MDYKKFRQAKAIEASNKKKLLKVNPKLDEGTGIYILWRTETHGYIGQSVKLLKLKEENPEDVKVIAINKDGSIFAHVPRKYVPNLRAPRKLTEEQRAELIKRGKNMLKWKVTDVEETPDFDFDDEDEEILDGEDKIGF